MKETTRQHVKSVRKLARELFLMLMISFFASESSYAQEPVDDTYCVKLKAPSGKKYFSNLNGLSVGVHSGQAEQLVGVGEVLSRFGEEPLTDSTEEVFRSVTVGAFNDLRDVRIVKIQKWNDKIVVTVKFVRRMKDSTVLVHKKILPPEKWEEFSQLERELFRSQPVFKQTQGAIHDGSTTVFEGFRSTKYHLIARHVISVSDPELQRIERFLLSNAGDIFDVECRVDVHKN